MYQSVSRVVGVLEIEVPCPPAPREQALEIKMVTKRASKILYNDGKEYSFANNVVCNDYSLKEFPSTMSLTS